MHSSLDLLEKHPLPKFRENAGFDNSPNAAYKVGGSVTSKFLTREPKSQGKDYGYFSGRKNLAPLQGVKGEQQ